MLFWPLHESLPSNRQSEQQCDWGISGSYDRQSVTQRRPCLLNMSLWNWQTTFFQHRQRATIDCTSHLCVSSCEICLLSTTMSLSPHHRVQPPLVVLFTIVSFTLLSSSETSYCPNRFQTHSDVNAGCVLFSCLEQVSFTMWTNGKGKGGVLPQVLSTRGKECHEESQFCEHVE